MFLLDNLLLAPGKAAFFLIKELARKAQEEWLDDESVKHELQEIYALLDAGKISDKEFEEREVRLVERLQQIAAAKLQQQGAPAALAAAAEVSMDVPATAPEVLPAAVAEPPRAPVAEMSFASIAASLRPFLDMVGTSADRPGTATEVGFSVEPLPDLEPEPPPPPPPPPPPAPTLPAAAAPMPVGPASSYAPPAGPSLAINEVVDRALAGLSMLRLRVSSVTAVSRVDDGWRVTAELVERRGVPDSSDLLGIYELRLDASGNILQWERTRMRRRCDLGH